MEPTELLYPIFHEIENHDIELKMRKLLKGHLMYDVKQTSNIGDILHELYKISSNDLRSRVDRLDPAYLTELVRNLFTEQKFNLQSAVSTPVNPNADESTVFVKLPTKESFGFKIPDHVVSKAFYEFGKHYVVKVIQSKLLEMSNKEADVQFRIERHVTEEIFNKGFEIFITAHGVSLNSKDHAEILNMARVVFNDSIKESEAFALNFLIWKSEAASNGEKFVNFLISHTTNARYDQTDLEYEFKLMIRKIFIIVDFYRRITPEQKSYDIIYFLGQSFLQNNAWSVKNNLFTQILVEEMMKLFVKTSDSENLKKGKEIFISYFTEFDKYSPPTAAYKKFIQNRYKRRGINFALNDLKVEYERMNRLQIIDILHCSIFMENELLSRKDIYTIFSSFMTYSSNFDNIEHHIFVSLRKMMIVAGNSVNDLPVFFDSLYDSFLQSTQYYSYVQSSRLGKYTNPAIVYNDYIDYIWKQRNHLWKYVSWIWLPDFVHFPYNINENYAFFKLINLATNVDSLIAEKRDLEFCPFNYENNYWIHKYTTTPIVRRLLNFVRIHKLVDQGFNYKILKGQVLDWGLLVKLNQYIKNEDQTL